MSEPPLLSAGEAEQLFKPISRVTLWRRIKRAYTEGDPDVRLVAGSYVAPERWWRAEMRKQPYRSKLRRNRLIEGEEQ